MVFTLRDADLLLVAIDHLLKIVGKPAGTPHKILVDSFETIVFSLEVGVAFGDNNFNAFSKRMGLRAQCTKETLQCLLAGSWMIGVV